MANTSCENCIAWCVHCDDYYGANDDVVKVVEESSGHYCSVLDTFNHRIPPDIWEHGCDQFHSKTST